MGWQKLTPAQSKTLGQLVKAHCKSGKANVSFELYEGTVSLYPGGPQLRDVSLTRDTLEVFRDKDFVSLYHKRDTVGHGHSFSELKIAAFEYVDLMRKPKWKRQAIGFFEDWKLKPALLSALLSIVVSVVTTLLTLWLKGP